MLAKIRCCRIAYHHICHIPYLEGGTKASAAPAAATANAKVVFILHPQGVIATSVAWRRREIQQEDTEVSRRAAHPLLRMTATIWPNLGSASVSSNRRDALHSQRDTTIPSSIPSANDGSSHSLPCELSRVPSIRSVRCSTAIDQRWCRCLVEPRTHARNKNGASGNRVLLLHQRELKQHVKLRAQVPHAVDVPNVM